MVELCVTHMDKRLGSFLMQLPCRESSANPDDRSINKVDRRGQFDMLINLIAYEYSVINSLSLFRILSIPATPINPTNWSAFRRVWLQLK